MTAPRWMLHARQRHVCSRAVTRALKVVACPGSRWGKCTLISHKRRVLNFPWKVLIAFCRSRQDTYGWNRWSSSVGICKMLYQQHHNSRSRSSFPQEQMGLSLTPSRSMIIPPKDFSFSLHAKLHDRPNFSSSCLSSTSPFKSSTGQTPVTRRYGFGMLPAQPSVIDPPTSKRPFSRLTLGFTPGSVSWTLNITPVRTASSHYNQNMGYILPRSRVYLFPSASDFHSKTHDFYSKSFSSV